MTAVLDEPARADVPRHALPESETVGRVGAARLLGVSPTTLDRLRAAKLFGPQPIPIGRTRFLLEELRAYLRHRAPGGGLYDAGQWAAVWAKLQKQIR
jgi:hypothetical protein